MSLNAINPSSSNTVSPTTSSANNVTSSPSLSPQGSPVLRSERDVQELTSSQFTEAALFFIFEEPSSTAQPLPSATKDSTQPLQSSQKTSEISQPQKKHINLDKLYEKAEEKTFWPTVGTVAVLAGVVLGSNLLFGKPVSDEFLEVLQKPDMY